MKFYIIAGEASGDLHASNLVKELKKKFPLAEFRGWGGDLMQTQGVTLVKHYRELAFMGFKEVLRNIFTILENIKICKKDIEDFKPDAVIFVDYPGFNLRIAKWAKQKGYKTVYYISPQVWAWKESRVTSIKRDVNLLICILPFEKDFYQKHNMDVAYAGHPLLDVIIDFKKDDNFITEHNLSGKPIVALLPGSRRQEIKMKLPVMLEQLKFFTDYEFVVAAAPAIETDFYVSLTANQPVKIIRNQTYQLLAHAHAALVTSGTATLETALFLVPQVVCYKGNYISYQIGKRLVRVPFISLVNLISDKEVVKELIQENFTSENLRTELEKILNLQNRERILVGYAILRNKLGEGGASAKAADMIIELMK